MNWQRAGDIEWLEADLDGSRACFSTRRGGVSGAPFESLNLGILTDDDPEAVRHNRLRLAGALGIEPTRVIMGRQVHGSEFTFHSEPPGRCHFARPGPPPEDADGQLTDRQELCPLVLVADCLPVAMVGEGGAAMLHCGWRGLAGDLVARAAERIGAKRAAVGPGIGPCCFEVGEEVIEAFAGYGSGVVAAGKLDLWRIAEISLRRAGLESVEVAGVCSFCDDRFFSHRRELGRTGRQAGILVQAA